VVRRGDPVAVAREVCREVAADRLRLSDDVSAYARRRLARLRDAVGDLGVDVHTHPGVTVVDPAALTTSGGGACLVFTPYYRRWLEHGHRAPEPAPPRLPTAARLEDGELPAWDTLVAGVRSPEVIRGGETAGRARLDAWLDAAIGGYDDVRDRFAAETSRLSADLHLGCVSPTEVADRIDRRQAGHEQFVRQLAWRDFDTALLAAHPDLPRADLRPRADRWRDDDEAFAAWCEGRTGYPVVDAGMRQLQREGWMHNRVRLLTASFLTKHLYLDWRRGAQHFLDLLVDGDLANNSAQWQWVAGTGTDARPNRIFNPVTQGERFDPDGTYVRRSIPELADVDAGAIHTPWELVGTLQEVADYPPPIVDHREARARFLAARSA